ncbi:unnamed protein product [Rangifer tarandus platyrhynchus]|uniref:Uncharacterized protein n=2 Tax=Rangifer tarandus platyrhynchus TaxID=3082113 RepID=A0ABN8YKU8_RANTA|nr:unnamed protein product [Rangifer tarandus platyrhynchus]CAI9699299.1 unnamed protein product [Rangifer tarandus platyrhynchus]
MNGLPGAAGEYALLNCPHPHSGHASHPGPSRPPLGPAWDLAEAHPTDESGNSGAGPAHSPRRRLGFEVRAAVLAVSSFLSFRLLCSPQSLTGPSREPQTPKVSARQPLPSKLRPGRPAARRRAGDQGRGTTRKPEKSRVQVRQEPDNNEQ